MGLDTAQPRVLFYPGSSIGNFTPDQALGFLQSLHRACGTAQGSGLLIGVDLLKDPAELEAAYDDALGVTAAFNLNALRHVNRVLRGASAATSAWVADVRMRNFYLPGRRDIFAGFRSVSV